MDGIRALHDVEAVGIGNIDHIVSGPTHAFVIDEGVERFCLPRQGWTADVQRPGFPELRC